MPQFEAVAIGSVSEGVVDLVTFELIEQIARTGSISAAASAMGVSQQAASERLRRAERLLGHSLVRRAITGSVLTEHGGMVLEWATPVLAAARRAAVSLEAMRRSDGALSVAASQTIAEHLLPRWLQTLRREDPAAMVQLASGNSQQVVDRVRTGSAALGFIESPDIPDGLRSARVGSDALVAVVAPAHPWVGAGSIDAAALAGTPLLVREAGSGTRATIDRWLEARSLQAAPPAAELATTSAIRAAAAAGVAPAVLSARAVADDVDAGRLVVVPFADAAPSRPLTAVWIGTDPIGTARTLIGIARRR